MIKSIDVVVTRIRSTRLEMSEILGAPPGPLSGLLLELWLPDLEVGFGWR